MTREQFFKQLEDKLRSLPEPERRNIIGVYEDLFQKALQNGKTDEEVIQSLGYSQLFAQNPAPQPVHIKPPAASTDSGLKATMASLALGLFNLIFVLGPFIGISGALFGLCAAALVLTTSPLWILIGSGIPETVTGLLLEVFGALTCFGLGTLLLLGMSFLVKGWIKIVKAYFRLNMRLIKGE